MRFRVFLAGLAAIPSLASATPSAPVGEYAWATFVRENGQPVCTETWTFGEGTLTVRSGEEIVRKSLSMEAEGAMPVLVLRNLETNGAPDCMGNRTPVPPQGEYRVLLVPLNSGDIQTCPVPKGPPPHVIGECYGSLRATAR
jgi:hypothetical protein